MAGGDRRGRSVRPVGSAGPAVGAIRFNHGGRLGPGGDILGGLVRAMGGAAGAVRGFAQDGRLAVGSVGRGRGVCAVGSRRGGRGDLFCIEWGSQLLQ